MRVSIKLFGRFCVVFVTLMMLGGCASVFKGNQSTVALRGSPPGLEVYENGKRLQTSQEVDTEAYTLLDSLKDVNCREKYYGCKDTVHYSNSIVLDDVVGTPNRTLTIKADGRQAIVPLESRVALWPWLAADIFIWGWPFDWYTGYWKEYYSEDGRKVVDVPRALSQGTNSN